MFNIFIFSAGYPSWHRASFSLRQILKTTPTSGSRIGIRGLRDRLPVLI
jgi:hypothetical protein